MISSSHYLWGHPILLFPSIIQKTSAFNFLSSHFFFWCIAVFNSSRPILPAHRHCARQKFLYYYYYYWLPSLKLFTDICLQLTSSLTRRKFPRICYSSVLVSFFLWYVFLTFCLPVCLSIAQQYIVAENMTKPFTLFLYTCWRSSNPPWLYSELQNC